MRLIYSQNAEDMAVYHQQTLALMNELQAQPNPINYHVLYEYILGENQQLVEEVNKLRQKKEQWSDITGIRLVENYFKEDEREVIGCEQAFIKNINLLSHKMHKHMQDYFDLASELERNPNKTSIIVRQLSKANRAISQDIRLTTQRIQTTKAKLIKHKRNNLTDAITGLHNEHHSREFLPYILKRNDAMGKSSVLALINTHALLTKENQRSYHTVDAFLQGYAKILRSLGKGTHAWRISDDEFLLTLVINNANEIKALSSDIYQKIASLSINEMDDLATSTNDAQQPISMAVGLAKNNFETTLNELTDLINNSPNKNQLLFLDDLI